MTSEDAEPISIGYIRARHHGHSVIVQGAVESAGKILQVLKKGVYRCTGCANIAQREQTDVLCYHPPRISHDAECKGKSTYLDLENCEVLDYQEIILVDGGIKLKALLTGDLVGKAIQGEEVELHGTLRFVPKYPGNILCDTSYPFMLDCLLVAEGIRGLGIERIVERISE